MYFSNNKIFAKHLQNLEDTFNSTVFSEKCTMASMVPEIQVITDSKLLNNIINTIFLPNNTIYNSNVRNVEIHNINNDKTNVLDAISNLCMLH